ncbi:unnamed protein product [Durusdinium trenchii]|uniref:Methyltransferase domain-containing protein n=1 Tax=Durusdinium trenchii TaxID=1381693 RepID=A0ABP0QH63_9DINO
MIHDVAGARAAALPVVFVAGGIEHQELGIEPGQTPTPDALLRLAERYGIQPLVWERLQWLLEPLLARDVERQVLHLGNGNSPLPEEMFDAGYVQQTAVDISEAAMTHMEARNRGCRPSIVWKAADCRRLDIPSDSFPLVVDKSTLDAFFCHDQHALAIMEFVKEAFRVTAVGGALISVSMHRPKSVLPWLRHKAFAWNVTTIPIEDGQPSARARPRCHAYICGPKRCEAQKSLEVHWPRLYAQVTEHPDSDLSSSSASEDSDEARTGEAVPLEEIWSEKYRGSEWDVFRSKRRVYSDIGILDVHGRR